MKKGNPVIIIFFFNDTLKNFKFFIFYPHQCEYGEPEDDQEDPGLFQTSPGGFYRTLLDICSKTKAWDISQKTSYMIWGDIYATDKHFIHKKISVMSSISELEAKLKGQKAYHGGHTEMMVFCIILFFIVGGCNAKWLRTYLPTDGNSGS